METSADNPDRMCVGCRDRAADCDLERFVYHDATGLVYDMRGGAPGEAAYVHPLRGCLRAASWAGFARSFGRRLEEIDAAELIDDVRGGLERRLEEQLVEAARLDELTVGKESVRSGLESGRLAVVMSIVDAPAGPAARVEESEPVPSYELARESVGDALQSEDVDRLGVERGDLGEAVGRTVEKLVCIEWDEK